MKIYNIKSIITLSFFALCLSGCTNLDEESFGSLSPDTYYNTEAEALSSVVGVYQVLSRVVHIGDPWRIAEFGTDEFIVPGRASGGWFDQNNIDIITHKVEPTSTNPFVIPDSPLVTVGMMLPSLKSKKYGTFLTALEYAAPI